MTLETLDIYFRSFLNLEDYSNDPSKNGIQVENSDMKNKPIKKIAFAVDACKETIEKAADCGANVLFVHHGLFWGHEQTITGTHFDRIKTLIENDIALYACHIPLDANENVGNNYGIAKKMGLKKLQPFGLWKGMSIGVKGILKTETTLDDISALLKTLNIETRVKLPFGKEKIKTIAIVSGGAEDLLEEAIDNTIDLYITGELSHTAYHLAKENSINAIAGGHYDTETIGVSLVAKKVCDEKNIEVIFLDVPTGL